MKRKFINTKSNIIRENNKSVPNLPAQNTRLLHSNSSMFSALDAKVAGFIENKSYNIIIRVVVYLLNAYGLRISEVLDIKFNDVRKDGMIIIKSKKKSQIRYISPGPFQVWLAKNRLFFVNSLSIYSRFYFYRLFKRLGFYYKFSGNVNTSVTHVFRYKFISDIQAMTTDIQDTQCIVGHKSVNNTKRYNEKSKKISK